MSAPADVERIASFLRLLYGEKGRKNDPFRRQQARKFADRLARSGLTLSALEGPEPVTIPRA